MSAMWTISIVIVGCLALGANTDGNVGCLLSKQVCEQDEWCYDDFAFGHCMASSDRLLLHDLYRYELETDALKQLEREFRRLFTAGYRWTHGYTQCIVKLMLRSFRHKKQFDRKKCEENQDEDLERALKFLEAQDEIDPKDVALIKFEPSAVDPESEFGDELFIPSKDMYSHLIKAGKDENSVGHVKAPVDSGKRKKKQDVSDGNSDKIIDLNRRLTKKEFHQLLEAISEADEGDRFPEIIDYPLQSDEMLDSEGTAWTFSKRKGKYDDLTAASQGSNFEEKNEEEDDELNNDEDLYYVTNSPILDSSYIFDRSHRYDVKKPGPFFKVNNYIFEKEERQDKMNEAQAPRIFQYHPLFEESDVSENSFRRHHQKQPFAELTADGMDHTNYYPNSDKKDSEQSVDALMRLETNRRDDLDDSPYFRDANGDEMSIEDNIVNEILLDNSNGDVMDFERNGDSQDLRNIFPFNINRKNKSKEMRDVLPLRNSQKSLNRRLKNDYSRHVKYHQEPGAVNHAVVVEKNSIKHNNNSEAKSSGVGETEKRIFSDKQSDALYVEPPDAHLKEAQASLSPAENNFEIVDTSYAYIIVNKEFTDLKDGKIYAKKLETLLHLPPGTFTNIRQEGNQITFKVNSNSNGMSASDVAGKAENFKDELQKISGKMLKSSGIGNKIRLTVRELNSGGQVIIITFIVCGVIAGLVLGVGVLYLIMHHSRSKKKLQGLTQAETEASQDYQELCRQRMAIKSSEKPEPIQVLAAQRISGLSKESETSVHSPSSRSSTSSWNEEPVVLNMDISTGHMVLSYMEDHLTNKDRLDKEWEALCRYEADPATFTIANQSNNFQNNRYPNILPYDHSRVILNEFCNASGFDYINANTITDHDPRNAAYIATQGPLPHTSADFWQMIWEQGSVVIVMLTRLVENGVAMCHRYWPEEGSELYHIYEVHLVSEHIWCEDYLIRNFYLKNLKTGETRTVTQFHFLSWPDAGVPVSAKMILDFRRKVNKSYRGRSCPIVIHCSDGCGRTGTYCLIDMVLNRMAKGLKEIDIAATLEHIRDQRIGMVQNKEQFQFVLMAVAEEVHSILKTIP